MDAVRLEDLMRYAPRASRHYIDALIHGWPALQAAGINTPLRWCHFIGQCYHETGGFTIVRENTTWTVDQMCRLWPHRFKKTDPVFRARYQMCGGDDTQLAELAYGGSHDLAKNLGNTEDGDGWQYRGGGFLQGTGRAWFREMGEAIGHDLEGHPDLIENPVISLQAALHMWTTKKINSFADANNLRAVGNAINRGNPYSKHEPIGADKRRAAFDRAWSIWGAGSVPTTTDLDVGCHGAEVKAVQLRLRELRYAVGAADGVFGPETGRAVAAFKADWMRNTDDEDLEPRTVVGPKTRAALAEAAPVERPEREAATVADLAAAGSTEVKAGQEMQVVGVATVGAGVVGVAEKAGVLDTLQSSVGWLPSAQSTVAPALDALKWCVAHLPFVALLLVGLLIYYRGYAIQQARLLAHRLGFNLGR